MRAAAVRELAEFDESQPNKRPTRASATRGNAIRMDKSLPTLDRETRTGIAPGSGMRQGS